MNNTPPSSFTMNDPPQPSFQGSLQFHHLMSPYLPKRKTVCLLTPDENAIKYAYTHLTTLSTQMGISTVNPDDEYVKKIGRLKSQSRLATVVLVPVSINFEKKEAVMRVFQTNKLITFHFGNKSGRVYFVGYKEERSDISTSSTF